MLIESKKNLRIFNRLIYFLFFLMILSNISFANYDNSIRIQQSLNYKINKTFAANMYLFQQIDRNISSFDYLEMGLGIKYQTTLEWLAFQLYYQQSFSMNEEGLWFLEIKPSVNLNLSIYFYMLKIYNQIRYEYRMTEDWSNIRIKNYLKISLYDVFLTPYIGWELFYENHYKQFALSRIKLGIIYKVCSSFSLGGYYRIDFSNKDEGWIFTKMLWAIQFIVGF